MSITYSQTGNGRQIVRSNAANAGATSRPATVAAQGVSCRMTVVIIERRELIRDCLAQALRATGNHEVIAFSSLSEWLAICDHTAASLVVLSCAGRTEAEQIGQQMRRLVQVKKPLPAIVVSDSEDLTQVLGALNNGARGFIPTNISLDVAVEAMRVVNAGGVFVPASCLAAANAPAARPALENSGKGIFTARQAAVVDGIRRGKANKMIAYELNLRESTVKVHIRNIMKKLNARNRTEVAFIANSIENAGGL